MIANIQAWIWPPENDSGPVASANSMAAQAALASCKRPWEQSLDERDESWVKKFCTIAQTKDISGPAC